MVITIIHKAFARPMVDPPLGTSREITNPALSDQLNNLSGSQFLSNLIGVMLESILIIGSILTIALLLWGGIQWILSGGDKAGLESARGKIVNALVGILILFSAFAIIKLIEVVFGITLLGPIFIPSI
ncbi:MAG: hypothetical protein Q7S03_02060 [bacterium]|nr:hypothetical protein [bacterium]